MRYKAWILGWVLSVGTMQICTAQLSPGDLVEAHAHLEGLSNCTKCHVLGQKVSNDKCLECHKTIQSLMSTDRGYHASDEVLGKDCFACHSDHHGRRFEIVRFDTGRFDHNLTGYTLSGAHRLLECAQCHRPEFIEDPELKHRESTYLGLETACISCHEDYHQGTLGSSCVICHDTDAFRPASGFAHQETDFPLKGAHASVKCVECHAFEVRNNTEYQKFKGLKFNQCSNCHSDPHNRRFGADCRSCHLEESFFLLRGQGAFDHNSTGFPLLGQHRRISCADCHDMGQGATGAFMDFVNTDIEDCASCHTDVHEGRFGADCRNCHSEESFRQIRGGLEKIDHDLTAFPLEGRHESVDCRACHAETLTDALAFQVCLDCHTDYHDGQFVQEDHTPRDCAECHTVDGFEQSSFSIAQHSQTGFPLEGAHLATPCFACHLTEENAWVFRDIGSQCVDCHGDIHRGELAVEYYQGTQCANCHVADAWSVIAFDHSRTGHVLEGTHRELSCTACHNKETAGNAGPVFVGLSTDCASCHQNTHRSQFSFNGATDCTECHGYERWKPSTFDHDSARFVLEGAHVSVACADCHTTIADTEGPYVLYKLNTLDCIDCHQ